VAIAAVVAVALATTIFVSVPVATAADITIAPGQAVRFPTGFTCSVRSKKTANDWFTNDAAFIGPTTVCSGVTWKLNVAQTGPVWLALDGQTAIREYMNTPTGWDAFTVAYDDNSQTFGVVGSHVPFVHLKAQNVPVGTMVAFGKTGASCGVLAWTDAAARLDLKDAMDWGPYPPATVTMCMSPSTASNGCVWTAAVFRPDNGVQSWFVRLGAHGITVGAYPLPPQGQCHRSA